MKTMTIIFTLISFQTLTAFGQTSSTNLSDIIDGVWTIEVRMPVVNDEQLKKQQIAFSKELIKQTDSLIVFSTNKFILTKKRKGTFEIKDNITIYLNGIKYQYGTYNKKNKILLSRIISPYLVVEYILEKESDI